MVLQSKLNLELQLEINWKSVWSLRCTCNAHYAWNTAELAAAFFTSWSFSLSLLWALPEWVKRNVLCTFQNCLNKIIQLWCVHGLCWVTVYSSSGDCPNVFCFSVHMHPVGCRWSFWSSSVCWVHASTPCQSAERGQRSLSSFQSPVVARWNPWQYLFLLFTVTIKHFFFFGV